MNDFAYVAVIIAFFALAGLFVTACDRIIGPDEQSAPPPVATVHDDDRRVAARGRHEHA